MNEVFKELLEGSKQEKYYIVKDDLTKEDIETIISNCTFSEYYILLHYLEKENYEKLLLKVLNIEEPKLDDIYYLSLIIEVLNEKENSFQNIAAKFNIPPTPEMVRCNYSYHNKMFGNFRVYLDLLTGNDITKEMEVEKINIERVHEHLLRRFSDMFRNFKLQEEYKNNMKSNKKI